MNTLELKIFLRKYKNPDLKIRVYAIDQLPKTLHKNRAYAFVINLSKITEPGSHWIGLYVDNQRNGFYMDSYGFKPRSFQLKEFLKNNCKTVSYNTQQLQQLTSKVCGMYASCFIIHMVKGHRFTDYMSKFSKNLLINDSFITKNFRYYIRN